jgi:uncharacterized protein (DUF2147 family)
LAALTLSPAIATAATDPSGVWLDDKGRGAVEIKPCGDSLCGYVVWVKEVNDQRGCGKQILGDVSHSGSGVWDDGWIYSPEKKKRYSVELKPLEDDRLRVKGYAGTKIFSKTMIWTKAPPDLVRCDVAKLEPGATPNPPANPNNPPAASGVKPQATPAPQPKQPETAANPAQGSPAGEKAQAAAPVTPKEPVTPQKNPQKNATAKASPKQAQKSEPAPTDVPIETAPDLSDLPIDKYFNTTADGRCKLNLPWVKLDFACQDSE